MPVVAQPRWHPVVVANGGLEAMLVSGQAGPLQKCVAVDHAVTAGGRDPPGPQSATCTATPAAAAHQGRSHNTEGSLDRVDPAICEQSADGRLTAGAAVIPSQVVEV